MKKIKASLPILFTLTCFVAFFAGQLKAQTPNCYITSVTDGDSFEAVYQGKIITCRLALIDAPELKQAFGIAARDSLSSLIKNKTGVLTIVKQDRYNRLLVKLVVGHTDVQEAMLEQGMAWVYTNYTNDKYLRMLELQAQSGEAGLWACKQRLPPWQFRGLSKSGKAFFASCN